MLILNKIKKHFENKQLKRKINRARICRERLKQEIKPYDWMRSYE